MTTSKRTKAKTVPGQKQTKKQPIAESKNASSEKRMVKIGQFRISRNLLETTIAILLVAVYIVSPRCYSITTALYNSSTEEDQKNVVTAMGEDNTEERFRTYFQWYNVIHELGHGLLYYNNGASVDIADEEQLVNDFAVAYWKYYGEEDKVKELEDIVNYAVENIGDNYKNGINYLKLAKENSNGKRFNSAFFNFNDYGWFQFSSVKHSFESGKDLDTVLKEMGLKDYNIGRQRTLVYEKINEEASTQVLNDAVENVHRWGLKFPIISQHFNKDPNENSSNASVKYLGLLEIPDIVYIFNRLF